MKTVLALETSGPFLSTALGTREGKIKMAKAEAPLQHSENLISLIDRLLKREKLTLKNIDAFVIDRGPGSFTGLRIGFSLLKGFLAAQKKSCFGAVSLDMIASRVNLPEGSILGVLVDARRERIYSRFYRNEKGEWVAEKKLEVLSYSELEEKIKEGMTLTGDALRRYGEKLRQKFGERIHFLPESLTSPSAATLVEWFQAQDHRVVPLKAPRDFLPLYFRASEAEEKRERKSYGA